MSDTPERKARMQKLLEELWELDEELGLNEIDLTPEEAVAIVKEVRKEMAEERRQER